MTTLTLASVLIAGCGSASETTPLTTPETAAQNSPTAAPIEEVGPSAQIIQAVCPFVFGFLQEFPDVPRYGIALSVAGQSPIAALAHAAEVGRISSSISQSSGDSFTQLWFEVASSLSSSEYQSGQGVPNDAVAAQALVSLNRDCVAELKTVDGSNDSAAKALKQASKACRNWPDLRIGVTKFTYMEPKNVKQRGDALKAAKQAAKLDPKWNSLVGSLIMFNENLGGIFENIGKWTDADDAVVRASVDLDKECAIISALK